MDILEHNRAAWDRLVDRGCQFTVPVGDEEIEQAKAGEWSIFLTPTRPVPNDWFPPLQGCHLLCLASGGGQQGPTLAAAGARVTVLDNSPKQLEQDELLARRHSLDLTTVRGDMRDLSVLGDESFDLIVHPVSNTFVPDVRPVWREAYRVLRPGCDLLSGFDNPVLQIFDEEKYDQGVLLPKYALPYSDAEVLTEQEIRRRYEKGIPLEFGHTIEDQIGGQIDAGFVIVGFYEDRERDEYNDLLSKFMPTYIATRAKKPE